MYCCLEIIRKKKNPISVLAVVVQDWHDIIITLGNKHDINILNSVTKINHWTVEYYLLLFYRGWDRRTSATLYNVYYNSYCYINIVREY